MEFMAATGRRISATIVDLISPKRDILTEFMAQLDPEFLQPSWINIFKVRCFNVIYDLEFTQNFCNHRLWI